MRCPSTEEIFDLVRDRSDREVKPGLRDHVLRCPSCREATSWIESALQVAAAGPLPEPPQSVLDAAFDLAGRNPARAGPSRPRRSLARLVQDTFAGAALVGVRSTGTDERRLLFVDGDTEIDLSVIREPPAEACELTGQVVVRGSPVEVFAALWSGDRRIAQGRGDGAGIFSFTDLPPGTYRLEIWVPAEDRILHVPEVPCCLDDGA